MKFSQPRLPYAVDALQPYISRNTIDYHYGKHESNYINTLNSLIEGTEFENMSLEDIIVKSDGKIFNNASQAWNHIFYFFLRFVRRVQASVRGEGRHPVRFRMGLAVRRQKRRPPHNSESERWQPHDRRITSYPDVRRMGARILSGLSEPPRRLPEAAVEHRGLGHRLHAL